MKFGSDLVQSLANECIQILVFVQNPADAQIKIGVKKEDVQFACTILQKQLTTIQENPLQLFVKEGLSTIAIVGKQENQAISLLPDLFENLSQKGVNVSISSLEHSELTHTFMVPTADLYTALEVTHRTVFKEN